MSEIFESHRQSRAEILYFLDGLVRHLNDEEAITPWLMNGVPDGTMDNVWPTKEQVEPFLDFVDDEKAFEDMVGLGLSILSRECFMTKREHLKRSLT